MMNEWIISSSVLIAAVLLGRFLLRGKIGLRLQYALWGIVLLRLLLPFQIFTSPFGTGAVSEQVDLAAPVRQVYHSANEDRYEEVYDTAYREVKHSIAIAHPDPIVIEQAARGLAQSRMELDLAHRRLHCPSGRPAPAASVGDGGKRLSASRLCDGGGPHALRLRPVSACHLSDSSDGRGGAGPGPCSRA